MIVWNSSWLIGTNLKESLNAAVTLLSCVGAFFGWSKALRFTAVFSLNFSLWRRRRRHNILISSFIVSTGFFMVGVAVNLFHFTVDDRKVICFAMSASEILALQVWQEEERYKSTQQIKLYCND